MPSSDYHSEEVQEILGKPPAWLIRWGITLMFLVILVFFALAFFIRYPDIISAEILITSVNPPIELVARSSGKIRFLVKDNSFVKKNTAVAYIENAALWEDIQQLSHSLSFGSLSRFIGESRTTVIHEELQLGELQDAYENRLKARENLFHFIQLEQSTKQIRHIQRQIEQYKNLNKNLLHQNQLMYRELQLTQKRFQIDSGLYSQKVITPLDLDKSEAGLLQQARLLKNTEAVVLQNYLSTSQLENQIHDLQIQYEDKKHQLTIEVQNAYKNLQSEWKQWQASYVIKSPVSGRVTFLQYWKDNQFVRSEEAILTVVPANNKQYLGKMELPVANSGKVKKGQKVLIRLANYPSEQYGKLEGRVQNISLVTAQSSQKQGRNYVISVLLPKGLYTNYRKNLPLKADLQGQADIITEERSLLERLFSFFIRILQ